MAYLNPPGKTKKSKLDENIDARQHETLEDALRDPKVANQLSLRFKYSDYLRNLQEIIKVVNNNRVSAEEAEHILPIKKVLHDYSVSLFEHHIKSDKVVSKLKDEHRLECVNLQNRILELETQVSSLQNLITFGENAFLLEDSCNAPQKKILSKITQDLAKIQSIVEKADSTKIFIGNYREDEPNYLTLLGSAIKDRFGPEGWELETIFKECKASGDFCEFFLAPKKEVYVAMGITDDSRLVLNKPSKRFTWARIWNWLSFKHS